jgi:hypothetical protein
MAKLEQLVDDTVRRHAPARPLTGFLGYQAADGYRLQDADDPRLVWGRTEDGNPLKAFITGGLKVAKDVAVVFKKKRGKTYAYPNTIRDAESGVAAQQAAENEFGLIDTLRLPPGLVGFVDGQLTLTLQPLIYPNWRGQLCRSLASPLAIGDAIAALGDGESAWVIAGTDERTNDSAYHVSPATEDAPIIQQAISAAQSIFLFQFQAAVLIENGQATLAFTFDGWKDLRPWGATATRRRDNLTATIDPTTGDDLTLGYDVFSRWLNTISGAVWQCLDSTEGAAVWAEQGVGGDMSKATYDANDNGVVDEAESVPWAGITDIPATFPPDSHTHDAADVTYTPATSGDWDTPPAAVADGLDELAGRVTAVEDAAPPAVSGGWTVDYDAVIPAGRSAFVVGPVHVTTGSLTLLGDAELYVL